MNETKKAIQEIEIYGFTILERVLAEDEAVEMRQALIRCEREFGEDHTHRGAGAPRFQSSGPRPGLPQDNRSSPNPFRSSNIFWGTP